MKDILAAIRIILLQISALIAKKEAEANTPPVTPKPVPKPELSPREIFYKAALDAIGSDASPLDRAPDDLACAETVNEIHKKAFGISIDEPGLSTIRLYHSLVALKTLFQRVSDPLPGDIIISPTGMGNGRIKHGHVGIVSEIGIMSNDSDTGLFLQKYTMESWRLRYQITGGFPMLFFRRV